MDLCNKIKNKMKMKNINFLNRTVCFFVCLSMLVGCTTGPDFDNLDKMIFVDYQKLDMYVGQEIQLTASPTNETFNFESSNSEVATVSPSGKVNAINVGYAFITVTGNYPNAVAFEIPVEVTIPGAFRIRGRAGANRAAVEIDIRNSMIKLVKITNLNTGVSEITDIDFQEKLFTVDLLGLQTGISMFEVVCIDGYGNESVPVTVSINVYELYYTANSHETDIGMTEIMTVFGNGLAVIWADNAPEKLEVAYTDADGNAVTKVVSTDKPLYLLDFQAYPLSDFSYTTIEGVLPEPTALDEAFFKINVVAESIECKRHIVSTSAICIIPVCDFDLGGYGVGWTNRRPDGVEDNMYRASLGDFESAEADIGDTYLNATFRNNDTWLKFTVYVETDGNYQIFGYYATPNNSHRYYDIDNTSILATESISTGGWINWTIKQDVASVYLSEGVHTIRFRKVADGGIFNITEIRLRYLD